MTLDKTPLGDAILNAIANTVLLRVERHIKAFRADTSAVAPEHLAAYEAGFRDGKRAALECVGDVADGIDPQDSPTASSGFMPQNGAVYRHYKGGLYQVLMTVRREGSAEAMVVYEPQDGTTPWVRPLSEFGEKFSYVSNTGWEPS